MINLREYPLFTAVITPLKIDLTLDRDSLSRVLWEQKKANLGLCLLGSTGESLNLGLAIRKQTLKHALDLNLKLPIMVGVPGFDLAETLLWLEYLETLPIDAYLMITPVYARAGDEGQFHWFKTLMDRVSRPVMFYNVPKRCGSALSLNAVRRLHEHPNYWGIKEASGSVHDFCAYREASNGKPLYSGDDFIFSEFAKMGALGLISVASNPWPQSVKIFVQQCLDKTFVDHDLWREACDQLFKATNPVAVKRLLFEEGLIQHKTLMPPLSENDFKSCADLLLVSKKIHQWAQLNGAIHGFSGHPCQT